MQGLCRGGGGALLFRNEPETLALWIVPSNCLVCLHDETGEWRGCQKTLIRLGWWTSPSGTLCQEVRIEGKSDALCGMRPIYKAGQSAARGGPVCPPGCPYCNPLVTATSEGCSPWQRGHDGQPVREIVSALAGLAEKANVAAFPKFLHSTWDWAAQLLHWAAQAPEFTSHQGLALKWSETQQPHVSDLGLCIIISQQSLIYSSSLKMLSILFSIWLIN